MQIIAVVIVVIVLMASPYLYVMYFVTSILEILQKILEVGGED